MTTPDHAPDHAPDHTPPLPEPGPSAPKMALAEWLRRLMWGYDTDPDTGMGPAAHASRSAAHADLGLAAVVSWLRAQADARAQARTVTRRGLDPAEALLYAADVLQDALPGYAADLPDQMPPHQAAELPALPASHLGPEGRINPLAR